ncbi:MAG: FAD-binding protein [Pseudomonadota bacterium]
MDRFADLKRILCSASVDFEETLGHYLPENAQMHRLDAPIPQIVISPNSAWGVAKVLSALDQLGLYDEVAVSVRSGGHGYHNGASCDGIMINLANLNNHFLHDDVLMLQPGVMIGHVISALHQQGKALPHGDCFDVHAGGHFTTAGWDFILTRKYGLGCQHVIAAKVVLWSGEVLSVDQNTHPDLFWAIKGGAAAEAGIVVELTMRVFEAPPVATWRFKLLTRAEVEKCVAAQSLAKAHHLPREVSISFRIHFHPDHAGPVCSFNIFSLFPVAETLALIYEYLGDEVAELVNNLPAWNTGPLIDVRMIAGSDRLRADPGAIAEATSGKFRRDPLGFWEEGTAKREMEPSHFATISNWTLPQDRILLDLMVAFEAIKDLPIRWKTFALTTIGSGKMQELPTALELGDGLSRFEIHWDADNHTDKRIAARFTDEISTIFERYKDPAPKRVYRGDIWQAEQAFDPRLEIIRKKYAKAPEGVYLLKQSA